MHWSHSLIVGGAFIHSSNQSCIQVETVELLCSRHSTTQHTTAGYTAATHQPQHKQVRIIINPCNKVGVSDHQAKQEERTMNECGQCIINSAM